MTFKNTKERDEYYQLLVNLYSTNDFLGFEEALLKLEYYKRITFLIYIFKNKESFKDINVDIMFMLATDCV